MLFLTKQTIIPKVISNFRRLLICYTKLVQKKQTYFNFKKVLLLSGLLLGLTAIISKAYNIPWDIAFLLPADTPSQEATSTDLAALMPAEADNDAGATQVLADSPDLNNKASSIQLDTPQNIIKDVVYDPVNDQYIITEKIGETPMGPPTFMSAEEYRQQQAQAAEQAYFQQRLQALSLFNQKPNLPTLYREGLFDRLFGSQNISIKPQGNLEIQLGYRYQISKNPQVTLDRQRSGGVDFDMKMNLNLIAEVGDKLKLNIANNTQPTFGEQNKQKIEFTGKEDEILKKIELGNTSFNLNSSLITGVQSLYGVKTQLQFGKLWLTGAFSSQRSQRKSMTIQGGGQMQQFEIKADDYDENRNFLVGQYFYNNYERALENFPLINSQVQITKVEVWITNRMGATQGVRDILSFMDLGESQPYQTFLIGGSTPNGLPSNNSNKLYELMQQRPAGRDQSASTQTALSIGLSEGQDFQRSTMRQLNASEYTFNAQLGFISLNSTVNSDDVVAVAYRYTYNGEVYQVGEFAEELPPDGNTAKVMYLKLLKGTASRPRLPIWNLMMKNVYSVGSSNIAKEDFELNVMYLDPGGGTKRYLPDGPKAGVPIIRLLNLDRLNPQNDPSPDGVFDFVDGITISTLNGKVIFPVLEPFGNALKPSLGGSPQLERRYLFEMLYDSTKTIARQFQQNNRFIIKGSYKGNSGTDISLGGFNIPEGSVKVLAGGMALQENVDFQVDYSMGRIKILNQGILNSGVPINVSYEDNAAFNNMRQRFMGVRADYFYNEKLTIGGTWMNLTERPITNVISFGEDPISNTVGGLDVNYQSESKMITRLLDKLPIYSTTTPSLFSFRAEGAGIFPGHSSWINALDPEGSTFIDNFEGANSSIDLKFPFNSWSLSSVPVNAKDRGGNILFPNATNSNELNYGYDRAKIAWYSIDRSLNDNSFSTPDNVKADTVREPYWRVIDMKDIFPDRPTVSANSLQSTFDLSFFPQERGPYNYTTTNVGPDGKFINPRTKFGGLQRALDNSTADFEASNVEYITFWVLDPFIYEAPDQQGDLYINLGSVSEDVLKDGRMSFENGIPAPKDLNKLDKTKWGYVPKFSQQVTRAFENEPSSRAIQDVGLDELSDEEEREFYADYLSRMENILGANSAEYLALYNDPAQDNYMHFLNDMHNTNRNGVITRYKHINNPHGNTPILDANSTYTSSVTSLPESEDLNKDNTLNEDESYYEYRVRFYPAAHPEMQVGNNFIVNKRKNVAKLKNGREMEETWYQFKIPIRAYTQAVGGIADFRSMRFVRMFLHGFEDSVTFRFAELKLDRNLWRSYLYSLKNPGEQIPDDQLRNTRFAINTVSIEQNSSKEPVNYQSPPGVERQNLPSGLTGQLLAQDEQSLSIEICGLEDGDSRAVFSEKRIDMRQNEYLRTFIHAASVPGQPSLKDDDLYAFIRIGSDFVNNYYEYRLPLKITSPGERNRELVWPEQNRIDLKLEDLVNAKGNRNAAGVQSYMPYEERDTKGNTILVLGNPNLGDIRNVMIGVNNPKSGTGNPNDDGLSKCAEVWIDELRLAGFNEKPGYAASAQANIQLADLGSINMSGMMSTIGYGSINQKVNERAREALYTYNINSNLNLGKLLPKNWGVQLPMYIGYTESASNPEYDPYDLDIKLKDKLASYDVRDRDSIRAAAQNFTSITSFNLSNIKILGNSEKQNPKTMPWSLKNFDMNYAYNKTHHHSPLLESDDLIDQRLGVGYTYAINNKPWEPFKKMIKSKSKWLLLAKDFNINYLPTSLTFRSNMHKIFGETIVRNIDNGDYPIDPTYYKNFVWDRNYQLSWDLTKSLKLNYTALNQSRIDEPFGRIDSKEKSDSLWNNVLKLGRNTYFNQTYSATYAIPTKKLPMLDWTSLTLSYAGTYSWTAASRVAYDLGNTMANSNTKQVNATFLFEQLYAKSRWLKAANTPSRAAALREEEKKEEAKKGGDAGGRMSAAPIRSSQNPGVIGVVPPRPEKKEIEKSAVKGSDSLTAEQIAAAWKLLKKEEKKRFKKELRTWRDKKKNILPDVSDGYRYGVRFATMLKRIGLIYTERSGTVLPGLMDSSQIAGVNTRSNNPWYGFAFGYQPNNTWVDSRAIAGQFSRDSLFNNQMRQEFSQNLNLTATLEPVQSFRIELNLDKNFSKYYSTLHKYDATDGEFNYLSPYSNGSYTATFIGIKSFFKSDNEVFGAFLNGRAIVSERLGESNPYSNGARDPNSANYAKGYTQYAQDVIVPAFLGAVTGKNSRDVPLMYENTNDPRSNPFKNYIPMPNWKINFNGLSKVNGLKDKVSNIVLSHAYKGNLSMNSFNSNLLYTDLLGVGFPSFIDSNSGNYVAFFQVPNITTTQNFSPIAGVEVQMKSGLSFSFKYNRSKMMSLSMIDYQISQTKSSEIVVGLGHRIRGLELPFSLFGITRLENDLNIRVDFGLKDDITRNYYFAIDNNVTTRGQNVLTFAPTVDYNVNENLQLRFYFEYRKAIPHVDLSYPLTNIRGGFKLIYMFAPQ